jgi:uncharacterized protein (DUF1330 family)
MSAFLFLEIDWHDPARATKYRELLGPTLDRFGGRTLVANEPRILEGDWKPRRVVIIEFPTMDALLSWYKSDEYAPLIRIRNEGAKTKMIAVERPPAA